MIAKASLTKAAQRIARRGTVTRVAPARALCGAAALLASLAVIGEAQAQEQGQQQQQQQEQQGQQFGPRANQAPPQQPQAPKPELVATHGDWAVQCQEAPGAAEGDAAVRTCGMFQTAQTDRQGVGLTLVVVKGEQDGKEVTMLRVMAPIGVYLPTGVALEIDGDAVGRVPFTRCMPQACVAVAEASPPTLEKMKAGGMANFIIYEGPGNGMALELSLNGFTAALGELNKL